MSSSAAERSAADRVLLGLGNTVDTEIVWDDEAASRLARRLGVRRADRASATIATASELLAAIVGHVASGSGGEHYVTSPEVIAEVAAAFETRTTLGGTNVRAALAMRTVGIASTVHLVSENDATRRLLPADIGTISSAAGDSVDPHLIVQFPAGARIALVDGEAVGPRANRVIFTNDAPNRELLVAETFGDAVARAEVILVSGFNSMQDERMLDARIADVRRHLARRGDLAVVVYEHGAFHVDAFSERVRERFGDAVDIWCCNEEELEAHLRRRVDLLDASEVLEAATALRAAVGCATVVVHTRYWALALGGDEARRRSVIHGGIALSGVRFAHGDAATAEHVVASDSWPRQPEGERFAAAIEAQSDEVSSLATFRILSSSPTTIGLGDAFVGGVVAALTGRASVLEGQDSETRTAEVPGSSASKTCGASPG